MHELSDNCNIFISLRLHALRKKLCLHKFQPFRRKTGSVLYIVHCVHPSISLEYKDFSSNFPSRAPQSAIPKKEVDRPKEIVCQAS